MDTTTSVILTGGVVALGRWSKDQKIEFRQFVGVGVLAIFIAAIANTNQQFAEQLALLVLIAALLVYVIPISKALGFTR